MPDFGIGRIVTSKAGRDRGKAFVVIGIEGDRVRVADGELRKVGSAKRKNQRHLVAHDWIAPGLESRIRGGDGVSDAEIRKIIEAWQEKTAGGGR